MFTGYKYEYIYFFTAEESGAPHFLAKLSPGHVLSDIGYSPSLLSKKTLKKVETLCLKASAIDPASLDSTEENKLQTGMAMTVQKLLKQRHAREKLFQRDFIGLRSDLALRRELRLPIEKVKIYFEILSVSKQGSHGP